MAQNTRCLLAVKGFLLIVRAQFMEACLLDMMLFAQTKEPLFATSAILIIKA